GIGPLARLVETDAGTWRRVFDTNVIGASLVTAAAIPYLEASRGKAIYLSSVNGGLTPPWPGLGAYGVSKAALDKLLEARRGGGSIRASTSCASSSASAPEDMATRRRSSTRIGIRR